MDRQAYRWIVLGLVVAAACGTGREPEGMTVQANALADRLAGWTAIGSLESYDTESIYGYIDGHAEVFMAYGMTGCTSRRYQSPDGEAEIVVDLFTMPSSEMAFGVFSHDRAGERVAVGDGGVYRSGWLSFWRGESYASIYWNGDGEPDRDAILAIGGAVAGALPASTGVPELVGRLPAAGLEPYSVCYLVSPQILNAHVAVGGGDPFAIASGAEAVVGRYDFDGTTADLVLVRYPDETAARAVEAGLRTDTEDRPEMMVGRVGTTIGAVIGEASEASADGLLADALGGEE